MAKRTTSQKAVRLLTFLLALRYASITRALEARGLNPQRRTEGWRLLAAMGDESIRIGDELPPEHNTEILSALDQWENESFRVARATLRRRHPEICDLIFADLSQSSGAGVVTSVGTFLDRIDQLPTYPDGAAAVTLLGERGLGPAQLDVARSLLQRLESLQPPVEIDQAEAVARFEAAERAMWAY
jgi:hypothetical protein